MAGDAVDVPYASNKGFISEFFKVTNSADQAKSELSLVNCKKLFLFR